MQQRSLHHNYSEAITGLCSVLVWIWVCIRKLHRYFYILSTFSSLTMRPYSEFLVGDTLWIYTIQRWEYLFLKKLPFLFTFYPEVRTPLIFTEVFLLWVIPFQGIYFISSVRFIACIDWSLGGAICNGSPLDNFVKNQILSIRSWKKS